MKDKYKKYIEYIVNDIEAPYLKSLDQYGLKDNEKEMILSKVFNQSVTIKGNWVYNTNGNEIYIETSDGNWIKYEYDSNGNLIYREDADGFWIKYEYDANGNLIYREDADGFWIKYEYDTNNNEIYYEDSTGYIEDNR